jgi:hypothetical protein
VTGHGCGWQAAITGMDPHADTIPAISLLDMWDFIRGTAGGDRVITVGDSTGREVSGGIDGCRRLSAGGGGSTFQPGMRTMFVGSETNWRAQGW